MGGGRLLPYALLFYRASTFSTVGYLPEWRYGGANFRTLSAHLT